MTGHFRPLSDFRPRPASKFRAGLLEPSSSAAAGSNGYRRRRRLPAIMGTEGVGCAIAVGNAANDAVEQALSKTSLAELIHGVGQICAKL